MVFEPKQLVWISVQGSPGKHVTGRIISLNSKQATTSIDLGGGRKGEFAMKLLARIPNAELEVERMNFEGEAPLDDEAPKSTAAPKKS